jgi:hypothetical protein
MEGSTVGHTVDGISLGLFLQLNTLPPGADSTKVKFKGGRCGPNGSFQDENSGPMC